MSDTHDGMKNLAVTAPHPGSASATDTRPPQTLSGTTGESSNAHALTVGEFATLVNGGVAIRYRMVATTGLSDQVATTDIVLGPYAEKSWMVEKNTCVVYVQSADGTTAYEAWVYRSSK